MQTLPLAKDPSRLQTGPSSKPPKGDMTDASQEVREDSAVVTKADCNKHAATFNLEVQAAINEQAAKIFDSYAERLAGQWTATLGRIEGLLTDASNLKQEAAQLAVEQAEGLREMARALRGA